MHGKSALHLKALLLCMSIGVGFLVFLRVSRPLSLEPTDVRSSEPLRPQVRTPIQEDALFSHERDELIGSNESPAERTGRSIVRSSIGLLVRDVSIRTANEQAISYDTNVFEWEKAYAGATLQVPGHHPLVLPSTYTAAITVEPETALILVSENISQSLDRLELMEDMPGEARSEALRHVCYGLIGPDQWGIALEPRKLKIVMSDLELVLVLSSGLRIEIRHLLESGRHDVHPLSALPRQALEPVEMQLEGCLRASAATARLTSRSGQHDFSRQPFGSVWIGTRCDRTTTLKDGAFRFPPVALGGEYKVTVFDPDEGCYAQQSFVHDGRLVVCDALQACSVEGRLVHGDAIQVASVQWARTLDARCQQEADAAWNEGPYPVGIDAGGRFSFYVPGQVPINERAVFPPPPGLSLRMSIPGFVDVQMCVPNANLAKVDLGTIVLERLPACLLLEAKTLPMDRLESYRFVESDVTGSVDAVRLWKHESGLVALSVENPDLDGVLRRANAVVVNEDGLTAFPFKLVPTGRLVEVPTAVYRIQATEDSASERGCSFGWEWSGLTHCVAHVGQVNESLDFEMRAPSEGVLFWWKLDGDESRSSMAVAPGLNPVKVSQ